MAAQEQDAPFSVRIEKNVMDKMRILAKENGRSLNKQIEYAVKQYLKAYEAENGEVKQDKAEQAQRGVPAWTPFLSQSQQEAANRLIAAGYPRHLWTGGFDDAERKLCAFFPDWQEEEAFESPLTALRCRWQSGEKLSHRDFLGAILGFREIAPYLRQNLTEAGRAKLKVAEIDLSEIAPPEKQVKVIHDTVSSPRLDAVMAAGFAIGRSKAAGLISTGKVELNHRPCVKPDRTVNEGDTLTCRGLGKCVLKEVNGLSKKGRTILVLERYL